MGLVAPTGAADASLSNNIEQHEDRIPNIET